MAYDTLTPGSFVEKLPDHPCGWIQWKGTNVCMDIYCACGEHAHIDDDFAYFLRMPCCGRLYAVGQNVRLYEVNAENPMPTDYSPIIRTATIYDGDDQPLAGEGFDFRSERTSDEEEPAHPRARVH